MNHTVHRSIMEKDTKGFRYACLYQDCEGLLPNASVYLKGEEIAEILEREWKEEQRICIDLCDPQVTKSLPYFKEDDTCIIAMPSYGGRAPQTALQRLRVIQGNHASAILVCSYGNRAYEDTLLEMKECAQESGFVCRAAIAAVAEHSIMHQYGAGRPDAQDTQELTVFARQIREHLEKDAACELQVTGNHPYKPYNGVPLKPSANQSCMQCGQCAAQCPVQAIPIKHPEKTDTDRCISCMRCIAVCPVHARSLNKLLLAVSVRKLHKACVTRKSNDLFL